MKYADVSHNESQLVHTMTFCATKSSARWLAEDGEGLGSRGLLYFALPETTLTSIPIPPQKTARYKAVEARMSKFSLHKKSPRPIHTEAPKRKANAIRRLGCGPEEEVRMFKFDEELQAEAECHRKMAPWHALRSRIR